MSTATKKTHRTVKKKLNKHLTSIGGTAGQTKIIRKRVMDHLQRGKRHQ